MHFLLLFLFCVHTLFVELLLLAQQMKFISEKTNATLTHTHTHTPESISMVEKY